MLPRSRAESPPGMRATFPVSRAQHPSPPRAFAGAATAGSARRASPEGHRGSAPSRERPSAERSREDLSASVGVVKRPVTPNRLLSPPGPVPSEVPETQHPPHTAAKSNGAANAERLGPARRAWTAAGTTPMKSIPRAVDVEATLETMGPDQLEQFRRAQQEILEKICAVQSHKQRKP